MPEVAPGMKTVLLFVMFMAQVFAAPRNRTTPRRDPDRESGSRASSTDPEPTRGDDSAERRLGWSLEYS
jgi:hypothetical protein